jgi:LysR family transcriptional regulator for bpeEF and oprC
MDRLDAMRVFVRVVDSLSFTRAAESLNRGTGTVSRLVQCLEEQASVRLLNRTTRTVSPTDEGRAYYETCVRVLEEIDRLDRETASASDVPSGRVSVGLSAAIAKSVLIPALPALFECYPKLDVKLVVSDDSISLAQDAVDCAIRIGTVRENSVVAREVGRASRVICAAPAYLARFGEPATIAQLQHHIAVASACNDEARAGYCEIDMDAHLAPVAIRSRVIVDDADSLISCALTGLGIISGYRFMLSPYLGSGALREIVVDSSTKPASKPVSIVYFPSRHMPSRLRIFIAWLKTVLEGAVSESEACGDRVPAALEGASGADASLVQRAERDTADAS